MICLKENSGMRHLAAKLNEQLVFGSDGAEAVLCPSWPTPDSIANEIVAEIREYLHLLFGYAFKDLLPRNS